MTTEPLDGAVARAEKPVWDKAFLKKLEAEKPIDAEGGPCNRLDDIVAVLKAGIELYPNFWAAAGLKLVLEAKAWVDLVAGILTDYLGFWLADLKTALIYAPWYPLIPPNFEIEDGATIFGLLLGIAEDITGALLKF